MGRKIYLTRFEESQKKTIIKILTKGLEIFFIYLGYITFMRLANSDLLPLDAYTFLFKHRYYTIVLFTFSILFLLSPSILMIYTKAKGLFLAFLFFLLSIYAIALYVPISESLINSEWFGILFGIGNKRLFYPIIPALIIYCLGFLIASYEDSTIVEGRRAKALVWLSLILLTIHSILVTSSGYYKAFIKIKILLPLISSILIFASLLLMRRLLNVKIISSILTRTEFMLIGSKTLMFYVTSNMILSFLSPQIGHNNFIKVIMFLCLFGLTYLVTSWSFYSEAYHKINKRS